MTENDDTFERDYDREMFRSSVFSALWALIAERKRAGFRLTDLADRLGKDKGYVSRLFSRQDNCKMNTISDLAHALDADVHVEIVDRKTGARFGPTGPTHRAVQAGSVVRQTVVYGEDAEEPTRKFVLRG